MRSHLQVLLEVVADDQPSAPLLPGLRSVGIDSAHDSLVVLARACRTGALALLAEGIAPTPSALARRLCHLRGFGHDSIGVAMTEVLESLCGGDDIEKVVGRGSRIEVLAVAENLIGIAQLMARSGEAPSTMVARMLAAAEPPEPGRDGDPDPSVDDEADQAAS